MLMPQAVNCPIANIGTHKNTNKKKKEKEKYCGYLNWHLNIITL